jgi:addiction module RelE/StbE family toxin
MELVWSSGFSRNLKRLVRQSPNLKIQVLQTLDQLQEDVFHPSLRTHKLKGDLSDRYACSVNYGVRIVFKFVENSELGDQEILLLAVGSHDEVY